MVSSDYALVVAFGFAVALISAVSVDLFRIIVCFVALALGVAVLVLAFVMRRKPPTVKE